MAEDMPADRHLEAAELWMWSRHSRGADCNQHVKCLLLEILHLNLTGLEAELRGVHTLLAVTGMKVPARVSIVRGVGALPGLDHRCEVNVQWPASAEIPSVRGVVLRQGARYARVKGSRHVSCRYDAET
jgi:hypothetical protein